MDIERHPFDLRECVESAMDLIGARAAEKHLDIAYVFEGEVPAAIDGDVTRLRQILLNLLCNSVKFTEKGEVVLSVRAEGDEQTGEGSLLHFTVRDTGIGLSEAGLSPPVPEVQPGRQRHHAQVRRHRAGPGDQQAAGRADGRHDVGRERRAGPGQHLPLHHALRAGRAAAGPAARLPGPAAAAGGQAHPGGGRQRHQPAHPGAADRQVGHGGAGHRVPGAGAGDAQGRSPTTWPSWTCTCRTWTGRCWRRSIREAGHTLPLVLFSRLGRKEATRQPVRRHAGQAAAPEPAVRHAGVAAGA